MTLFKLTCDLEVSIEEIIVICMTILTIIWMLSIQQFIQTPMEFKSNSNTRKSPEIESEGIRSKNSLYHISEGKWTPTMVHAA
jgi:hypothetical protein